MIKIATGTQWPPMFLWLGKRNAETHAVYVKLTRSYDEAVAIGHAVPTTMSGLGKWGRLTIPLPVDNLDLLFDWVDESYRNVAPKKLVAQLDARPAKRDLVRRPPTSNEVL